MTTDKKERFFFYNTLACMLSGAVGYQVHVEMKNEVEIRGDLTESDGYMNMTVSGAIITSRQGIETKAEHVKIKGSNVRYVHMPPQLNPVTAMKRELQKATAPRKDKFQVKRYSKNKASKSSDN